MDFGAKASGTNPGETQESVLAGELAKLKDQRSRMKEESTAYLQKHPELRTMLDEFMVSCLTEKPSDVLKHAVVFFTKMRDPKAISGPMPLVITGCNGAGKTSVVTALLKMFPDYFAVPIKHTSRAPRQGEENGVHYHFTQKSEMEGGISRGEFIEYNTVANSLYGTRISAIDDIRFAGKICLLDSEYKGIPAIVASPLVVKYVFVAPPSIEALSVRLKEIGSEPTAKITERIKIAAAELESARSDEHLNKVVVNDNVEQCVERIIYDLEGWYTDFNFSERAEDEES